MQWNWLLGLVYGAFGGLFEFLPASPQVHQVLVQKLTGVSAPGYGMSLAVHLGALSAVILAYYAKINKLYREHKLLKQPRRSRKRQPDVVSLMQLRLLKTAAVPMVLACFLAPWLSQQLGRLWLMALMVILCGIVVLLPNYMARGNKDARSISPLDALLIGLSGMLGALPGVSRVATMLSVGSMRGVDRTFGLDFTYLLAIPALVALCITDIAMIIIVGDPQAGILFVPGVMACIAAFGCGVAGIHLLRFLAVKVGFESFAYYNWGLALFALIIYIIG